LRKIGQMTTRTPDLLALLRDHADKHGDQLAHVLPDRDITYRRLWSRIERGSARLFGEWGVREGDLVAYVGRGHPDAIVLYFALLRLGAMLLPLESLSTLQTQQVLAEQQPKLLIQDHGGSMTGMTMASMTGSTTGSTTYALEALLANWSHHDPVLIDDPMSRSCLFVRDDAHDWQLISLDQLCASLPATPRTSFIDQHIFTTDLLLNIVLPSLRDHRLMQFAATDKVPGTGS
jgi:non-ribosomal peptide synthetase component E (peptide arylation enzyme)